MASDIMAGRAGRRRCSWPSATLHASPTSGKLHAPPTPATTVCAAREALKVLKPPPPLSTTNPITGGAEAGALLLAPLGGAAPTAINRRPCLQQAAPALCGRVQHHIQVTAHSCRRRCGWRSATCAACPSSMGGGHRSRGGGNPRGRSPRTSRRPSRCWYVFYYYIIIYTYIYIYIYIHTYIHMRGGKRAWAIAPDVKKAVKMLVRCICIYIYIYIYTCI